MGTKRKRLESLLLQEISNIIQQHLSDPRIGFVTITDVILSNDFKHAKVHFSALNPMGEEETEANIHVFENVLNHSAPEVQKIIAASLKLRFTPRIHFQFSEGLRKSMEMSELIRKARSTDLDHLNQHEDGESE